MMYMVNNIFPILFIALLVVLFWVQTIRRDLAARLKRFDKIDVELEAQKRALRDCPVFHDDTLKRPTP
jgi:hypothetical protein